MNVNVLGRITKFLTASAVALSSVITPIEMSSIGMTAYASSGMSASQITENMGVGWNLGNSLESTNNETAWGNPATTKEMIDDIAENTHGDYLRCHYTANHKTPSYGKRCYLVIEQLLWQPVLLFQQLQSPQALEPQ